ncbi:hypothetical protein K503DRAFT_868857 [Rhizopogon vinicolor AM-OR11-026]|uniref:beta-N-acetylhexosaminidase n=1 Tax=Rhizopogon vinicolor AM-OR11-026 TaxID=1314800 RepID=A0A1B7MPI1_9AGAM|nr:hypothetical protein K503DRAFT_868857 [Rhizopogon vinicolor AM-OR11-026]
MAPSRYVGLLVLVAASILPSGMTALEVSPSFYFDVQVEGAPVDLYDAVGQVQYYLETDQPLSLTSSATVEPIASEAVTLLGTRSEEHQLTILADGSTATLTANSTLGLYRGLTTFNQLFYYYGGVTYTLLAPISITETPAYPFRGLALDTSRNYYPVTDILRTLDAMSWVKEIDTPGHTVIIGATYTDSVACFDAAPWATYANEPPAGHLRFALPEVIHELYRFLARRHRKHPSFVLHKYWR